MFDLYTLLGSWGFILQAVAIIHFIKRRPHFYWLWIILAGGGIGAIVYVAMEILPDLTLLRGQTNWFARRKRLKELQAIVLDNPAAGNYEELGDVHLEMKNYSEAKASYDKAISTRTDSPHPFYGRGQAELQLGMYPDALRDLEEVVRRDPRHDFLRAQGLLAHAYARTGNVVEAERWFKSATETSTISETLYHYALFLKDQGRHQEARQWAQRILSKQATLPVYLKRRERPWFWKAKALISGLPRAA